jgi:glycosyltransferase involved in cell wall biosynthesis
VREKPTVPSPPPPKPLVSAIIPVYNRSWFIGRAVESVLAQDYGPLELIVVDDGSRDATSRILEEVAQAASESGVAYRVLRQENRGVSAARNLGIRHAEGEWIALLDSDDEWLPAKTSRQMDRLLARPELDIIQTDEIWVRRGVRVNAPARLAKREGDLFARCLDHCAISPSAVMMRAALFDEVGLFDESYPACEDYELWLRIAHGRPVGLVPERLLVKYGGHRDQLSSTIPALDRLRIRAIVKTIENEALTPGQRAEALAALRTKCRIYAQGCRKRGRQDEALEILALPERYETSSKTAAS